jgi:hypothetical protein
MGKFFTFFTMALLTAGAAISQTPIPKIEVVGMSSYQFSKVYGSQGTRTTTSGLRTVGKGSVVYLSAADLSGGQITAVTWSLLNKPTGSTTTIDSTNVPFTTMKVDTNGQYVVRLSITTSGGTSSVSDTITSAYYQGVGFMGGGGASIQDPKCGLCHLPMVQDWVETPHAVMFQNAINGTDPRQTHYSSRCVTCHTTGYDLNANNGGFDDVQAQSGWTFPSAYVDTNFTHLNNVSHQLAQLATIGCENCHGPGSEHNGQLGSNRISISMDVKVCAKCHDAPTHHMVVRQYATSSHGKNLVQVEYPGVNNASCAKCHNGTGFYLSASSQTISGAQATMSIGCASCHDPHSDQNPHQLRKVTADSLMNGYKIASGGLGQLCMNCHKGRRNANVYTLKWASHYGPHYGTQTDMFFGQNAYQFGDNSITGNSTHTQLEDACVTCHMSTAAGNMVNLLGGHTWNMSSPDSTGKNIVDNVAVCQSCHGPIASFDDIQAADDYDGNGKTEGVQTEVKGLLAKLAAMLPKDATGAVATDSASIAGKPNYLRAVYDYYFVANDGSYGVHNAKYTFAVLTRALSTLTGVEVVTNKIPRAYALDQNYPNPFNPTTTINFSVPKSGIVKLIIYNSVGQEVASLADSYFAPGTYKVTWDGKNSSGMMVSSGVYFCKLVTRDFAQVRKMMLMK